MPVQAVATTPLQWEVVQLGLRPLSTGVIDSFACSLTRGVED